MTHDTAEYVTLRDRAAESKFSMAVLRRQARRLGVPLYQLLGDRKVYVRAANVERLLEQAVRVPYGAGTEEIYEEN